MEQKERVVFVTSASLGAELEGIPELTVEDLLDRPFYLTERDTNYRRGAGPLSGRPEPEPHPLPGVQRHVFSHPHSGEQPWRLPAALVCGGAERGAGESSP